MAVATPPTQVTLIREALEQCNAIEKFARARDEWFPHILRDMASRRDWKVLESTAVVLPVENSPTVSLPSDYSRWIRFVMYRGYSGTAQAGAAVTITLAAGETIPQVEAQGRYCIIVGGTGSGQYRSIVSYNTSTKLALLDSNWTVMPDATSEYLIGTEWQEMCLSFWEDKELGAKPGVPDQWAEYNGELVFNRPPDSTVMAGLFNYYTDVDKLDLASADMMEIYARWRQCLHWGVCYRAWLERGDQRVVMAEEKFEQSLLTAARLDERQRRGRRTMAFRTMGGLPRQDIGAYSSRRRYY